MGRMQVKHSGQTMYDKHAELFSDETIQNRMFIYLLKRFEDEDAPTWSEGNMQDWDGMVLRKRVIVDCLDELMDQMKVSKCGFSMYQLLN